MAEVPTAINESPAPPRKRIVWPFILGGIVAALLLVGSFKLFRVFGMLAGTVEDLSQQVDIDSNHREALMTETPIEKSMKVKLGMSQQDVLSIMGKPDTGSVTESKNGSIGQYSWRYNDKSVVMKVKDGVVESITRPKL